jgi:hypothetical protein
MDNLDIYLLIISVAISWKITSEIFTVHKTDKKANEARIFFEEMSSAYVQSPTDTDFKTTGLTLCKKKGDKKYTLLPQKKLVGLGLS